MNKNYSLGMILVCILVGYFWLQPLIFNFGSEIIDGRMEISLSQTTITSFDDIFSNIEKDKSLTPYFLLLL